MDRTLIKKYIDNQPKKLSQRWIWARIKSNINRMLQAGSCRQKNSRPNPPDGFLGNVPC